MATLRGLITLILLLSFVGIVLWTLRGVNKSSFDRAARIPLEDDPSDKPAAITAQSKKVTR